MPAGLPRNPYIAGDPVGKTPAFVGREDVLRAVKRVLSHPNENAITLYGQRRIGKTSILQWLEAHLPEEGAYRPVYFDLMGYAGRPLGEILSALAAAIARTLRQPRPQLSQPLEEGFRTWLEGILSETLPAQEALVLLMDEFDVQADPHADKGAKLHFFAYMRDLRRLDLQRLQFVFVLGRTLDDLDIVAKGLFKDLRSLRVSLFSREETERVVRLSERDGSLTWHDDAVAQVWDWAGGHPYLTQALCASVWERAYEAADEAGEDGPPPVTPDQVDAAVPDALARSENMFTWLWDGLGPAERIVAAALAAAGPGVVGEDTLTRILNEAGVGIVMRELRNAPRLLQEWDILAPADGGYRFRVEMLRRWIEAHKPLSRVQDELDRLNPVAENLYQAARGLYQSGQWEPAVDLLQQALEVNPNHLGAQELLAEAYLAQGNLDEAQKVLEGLHDLAPQRARPRLKQVYLQRAEQAADDEQRLAWYEKVLALYSEDPQAREGLQALWQARGEQALAKGDLAAASKAFAQALTYGETPLLRQKLEEVQTQQRQQAVEAGLREVRRLEEAQAYPEAYEKLQTLAKTYSQARDWTPELERLERLSRLEALYRQALAHLEAGEREPAQRLLAQVIALDPAYREAARYLYVALHQEDPVEVARERGRLAASLKQAQQALAQGKKGMEEQERRRGLEKTSETQGLGKQETLHGDQETTQSPTPRPRMPRLSPWNPRDYLRLLWWILVTPQALQRYREQYGQDAERAVGGRLAYTLILWPSLIPAWGLALGVLPRQAGAWAPDTYIGWAAGLGGLWLLVMFLFDILERVANSDGVLGAALGGAWGRAVHAAFPAHTAGPGAYALVGMGAVVAASTHAPITAILVIFELTNDYRIIPPLMLACVVGVLLSGLMHRESIYTEKLARRGIRLREGRDVNLLRSIRVGEVMDRTPATVPASAPLPALIERLLADGNHELLVTDASGALVGTVTLAEVGAILPEAEALGPLVRAADAANGAVPVLLPTDTLDLAMQLFGRAHREELPVCEDRRTRKVVGTLTRDAVIGTYNRRLIQADLVGSFASLLEAVAAARRVVLPGGYVLTEVEIPAPLHGRTLAEAGIRSRFGVEVLLVRRPGSEDAELPAAGTRLEPGDRLLVLGPAEAIAALREA